MRFLQVHAGIVRVHSAIVFLCNDAGPRFMDPKKLCACDADPPPHGVKTRGPTLFRS